MLAYELTQSATGGNTIDSIIETANQLYKVIQLQDAYQDTDEGSKEEHEHAKEHMIVTSKSIGGETEIVEERLPEMPTTGGTGLERAKSAPLRNLSPPVNLIRLLKSTLLRLKRSLKHMQSLQSGVEKELKEQLESLTLVVKGVEPSTASHMSSAEQMEKSLDYMIKKLLELISMVPVSLEKKKKESPDEEDDGGNNHRRRIACLPAIHGTEKDLKGLAVFRDVQGKFEKLSSAHLRICLLSFAVFPENQEVNGTMLMYWWIGEGILPDGGDKPEAAVKSILKEFTEKKLIEPVRNKYKAEPSSYKMAPFVHSSVVLISKEIGLFDMYHQGTKPTMNKSALNKVCLVEGSSRQPEAKGRRMNADHIETVFNVSERFPDFTCRGL